MGRLTERNPVWIDDEFWTAAREPYDYEITDVYLKLREYENTGLTPTEVAELAQAKRDGRLRVLPCKVGDTVYQAVRFFTVFKEPKAEVVLGFSEYGDKRIDLLFEKHVHISVSRIGKTIFLTKAEAQAALDRMEEQE